MSKRALNESYRVRRTFVLMKSKERLDFGKVSLQLDTDMSFKKTKIAPAANLLN